MRTLFFILLVLVSAAIASAQDRTKLDKLRAEGYEALYNLDYDGARRSFQKMLDLAPDNPAGAQCYALSLWLQQLNEQWLRKSTFYSDDTERKPETNRAQIEEFRKWIRRAKLLSQAQLKKDPRDVEALYFLGAAEGLEAVFAAAIEKKYMAAFRAGQDSADHHREVLKLSPDFRDAELTIGLQNYIIGSLPLPAKMLAATMGVRGSKKRGLQAVERVAAEGHWARDVARVLLVDIYKREKRWQDAAGMAQQLSEKYPRNFIFKRQMADARQQLTHH
jgi:hypothetical protein